jgi:aspartyl-tRNA(Asn)/glutamyl-tRNA(Gln) amidotransferase subunit B
VDAAWSDATRAALPELPWTREERLVADHALPAYDAGVLTEERALSDYFEELAGRVPAKAASNWVMTEVLRHVKESGWDTATWRARVPADRLAGLIGRVESGALTGTLAKQALQTVVDDGGDLDAVLARPQFQVRGSSDDLLPLVRAVLEEHPGPVAQYLGGKTSTLGFLVGQVMKKSGGQAVPQVVQELLRGELAQRS